MTDKIISSVHVQKLAHNIQEIRERALFNIISKLDHGFTYDNDLARSKEILARLLEWFLFEPCTCQEAVFSLIKRILQSESGKMLVKHQGPDSIKRELKQIRTYIEPKFYSNVDDILCLLDDQNLIVVPPLETDIPLSYRTGESTNRDPSNVVDSTATTISGLVQQSSSDNQLTCPPVGDPDVDQCNQIFIIEPLKWQTLIEPDQHVLQSVEDSLRNPPKPADLLHSSQFFIDVLLHDFPAEVFLQRPTIVNIFLNLLLNCPSTRVVNSVLNCLINLTKELQIRINYYNDPCLYESKDITRQASSRNSLGDSPAIRSVSGQSVESAYKLEDAILLKNQRLTFPRYCCTTLRAVLKYLTVRSDSVRPKPKPNQVGANMALGLLDELVRLLGLVLNKDIWNEKPTPMILEIFKGLNEALVDFGDILEHFRLEASTDDSNLIPRVIQLCLLNIGANLLDTMVPVPQAGLILPKNLKNSVSLSLVDVAFAKLYPQTHKTLVRFMQSFSSGLHSDSLVKYQETDKVCKSLNGASHFLQYHKTLSAADGARVAKEALPSLEFHKDGDFVKYFVEICSSKLPMAAHDHDVLRNYELTTLGLLAHNVEEIKERMYSLCQRRVIAAVGPKLNHLGAGVPGSQILFLLRGPILTEIAMHGMMSSNLQIQKCSEDILIHLLKCKILVSDDIWDRVVEALISSMPIILCHSGKNSSLGRTLLNTVDPDTAKALLIPEIEVLRGNINILFSQDGISREEAFSRLCWLLASETNSRDMLPRLNNLYDKALPNACQARRILDINKQRNTQHFYQPSSLQQVLDLLQSPNVEPVIRRSALTQISVMMEDPLLHTTFLNKNGLNIVLDIMRSALFEKDFQDYPDSIIPAISILKSVCLYQPSSRQELSVKVEVYRYVLRGLFMFFAEERLKQDASTLLFLLVFHDFVLGSPSKGDLSIPHMVTNTLQVPFTCRTHCSSSPHTPNTLQALLMSDKWCLSSIQIQWNLGIFGGFDALLALKRVDYTKKDVLDVLKLSQYDLDCLKASSIKQGIGQHLITVQNATTHDLVLDAINRITLYIHLFNISKTDTDKIMSHPWESTFSRFLKVLPSSDDDVSLLDNVLKLLQLLVPLHKPSETPFWIVQMLKNSSSCLLDLLNYDTTTTEASKSLQYNLLKLITLCVNREQHFLDFYNPTDGPSNDILSWRNIITIIADNLKFSDTTHFYNLAYLDALLSTLVHLTANLGWSTKSDTNSDRTLRQLVSSLCELVVVFHGGKGPTAAISVMGLSITRHAVLILNHLLAEMRTVKHWDQNFIDLDHENWLRSFLVLWSSRDVVLRAAALQLFAGLSTSSRLAFDIMHEFEGERQGAWQLALTILLDHEEASVVREYCALFLANLAIHTNLQGSKQALTPNKTGKEICDKGFLFNLLDDFQFYKHLTIAFNALYTNEINGYDSRRLLSSRISDVISPKELSSTGSSSSICSTCIPSITTPSFVKSVAFLLIQLLKLDATRLISNLHDNGLVKLIFRCICNPTIDISDTKRLSLYCEIMEMNIAVCSLLTHTAYANYMCLGTIMHTRDCLSVMVSLLNSRIYYVNLPQLVYLRNKLWCEIFKLLSALVASPTHNKAGMGDAVLFESLTILSETIVGDTEGQPFTDTLCEALRSIDFPDLQDAALAAVTSLVGVESERIYRPNISNEQHSMQHLLDSGITSNNMGMMLKDISGDLHKMSLDYSSKKSPVEDDRITAHDSRGSSGIQICRILLNLFDLSYLKANQTITKKKSLIISALTVVLAVSREAKKFALATNFLDLIVRNLRNLHLKLGLKSVDCLRRVQDKKHLCPLLDELEQFVGLITNFLVRDDIAKHKAAHLGLADVLHKLWAWCSAQRALLVYSLKLLCTFTTECSSACQSLTLTSSVAGSGPRKMPTKLSLLHAIISLVEKEMDQVSRTRDLDVLRLSFEILNNCCSVTECRILLSKSDLLRGMSHLHPAVTKRQKPWDVVEAFWLEFLQNFSVHPEGQFSVKTDEVLELLILLTSSSKPANRVMALTVLRNLAFYQPNRTRLLTSREFLKVLQAKLDHGDDHERALVVLIMWSLSANNQKAKVTFKAAQLDAKLEQTLKRYELMGEKFVMDKDLDRMRTVLCIIRDGDFTTR